MRRAFATLTAFSFLVGTSALAATVTIPMMDGQGKKQGTAVITDTKNGVEIKLDLQGLTPGEKAMHFHQKGDCKGPDFASAGGHFAPGGEKHGHVEGGPHAGDMPNLTVDTEGRVKATVTNEKVSLGKKDKFAHLRGAEGTALVVHAKADDYKSQPSGDAGDRVLCGVVSKAK